MPQKTKNQEYSECSRNSSRCEDSSGGRLRSNRIDFDEDGKLSNRSNATSSGERKRSLYRNEVKVLKFNLRPYLIPNWFLKSSYFHYYFYQRFVKFLSF